MTPAQLIDDVRALGPQPLSVILRYIAAAVPYLTTSDGRVDLSSALMDCADLQLELERKAAQ